MYLALLLLLIAIMFLIIGYMIKEAIKLRPFISDKWKLIDDFSKKCLYSGMYILIAIPIIKGHPYTNETLGKILTLLFENIGIAIFAYGVIEGLKVIADHKNGKNKE